MFTHVAHRLCLCVFIYFASTLISLIKHLFQASLSNASRKKNKPKKYADCQKTEDKTKIWLVYCEVGNKARTRMLFFIVLKIEKC